MYVYTYIHTTASWIFVHRKKSVLLKTSAHLVAFPFRDLQNEIYFKIFTLPRPRANTTIWTLVEVPVRPCSWRANTFACAAYSTTSLVTPAAISIIVLYILLLKGYTAWICAGILSWNIIDEIRIAEDITSSSAILYGVLHFATSRKITCCAWRHFDGTLKYVAMVDRCFDKFCRLALRTPTLLAFMYSMNWNVYGIKKPSLSGSKALHHSS